MGAAATLVPAVRGARASTISALNDPAHPPRRRARLIALSARLPVPLLFAVRLIARRPRRAVLTAASLTIAVAMIDAQRPTALSRALGATPWQISAGLTAAQLIPDLIAACLGIPAGLALYQLAGGHLQEASPPLWWLLAVIPGTLLVVALLTAIPARIGAARSPAEILRSD